jgi:hypothetical protein
MKAVTVTVSDAQQAIDKFLVLLEKYSREIPKEEAQAMSAKAALLRDKLTLEGKNPVAVKKELQEMKAELTNARLLAVIALVKKLDASWANGEVAEPYAKLQETKYATVWLTKVADPATLDTKTLIALIDEGRGIALRLKIPWGRCKCGKMLLPVAVRGKWKVFPTCNHCYMVSISSPVKERAAKPA